MKFIFPQNYNFKNKLFGFIEYSTIFLNLIWDLFVFIFINLFNNLNLKIFLFFIFGNSCFALGEPKLISKMNSAFENIESWLLKLSTPAAAVAVGTGVFMKKFSFGDEERIRMGKKIIKGSLFSYAFILAIDLILSAIKSLIS